MKRPGTRSLPKKLAKLYSHVPWRNKELNQNGPLLPKQPSDSYKHTPLPSEEHIRILILQPGSKDDPICCKITVETRDKAENTYDAISYVWGDPTVTKPITCDNATLFITVNLFDALCALRDPAAPLRLWADAICINQSDDVEKGHQVKKMGNIYQDAKSVFGWVGPDIDGQAAVCFEAIHETRKYLDDQVKKYGGYLQIPRLKRPDPIRNDWSMVEAFLELPWFSRVWVTQEVGLARQCFITWGDKQLDIAELIELAILNSRRSDLQDVIGINGLINNLIGLASTFVYIQATYTNKQTWRSSLPLLKDTTRWRESSDPNFQETLAHARGMFATDPRDHIYAFLGHPSARKSNGELIIEPQYDKDVEDVMVDLACACLTDQKEGPFVLRNVHFHWDDEFAERTLPSWVPIWHLGLQGQPIAPSRAWWEAGGKADLFEAKVEHREPFTKLKTKAIIFDHLNWVSNRIHTRELDGLNLKEEVDGVAQVFEEPVVDKLRRQAFEAAPFPAEQLAKQEDAFSFCLVLGYGWNKFRALTKGAVAQHRLDYAAYLDVSRVSHAARNSGWDHPINNSPPIDSGNGEAHNIQKSANYWHLRKMVCTKNARLGIVPGCTKMSDVCCIIPGTSVPFILRPLGNGVYNLIGDAYIHGIMNGELMEELKKGKRQLENITLV